MADVKTDQETAIGRYRDERTWNLDVSDTTVQAKLERLGYKPTRRDGPYRLYRLPLRAIAFRSEKTIRSMSNKGNAENLRSSRELRTS